MKEGDLIQLDSTSNEYPIFSEDKYSQESEAFLYVSIKLSDSEEWEGVVESISTTGKYRIRLTKRI